MRTVHLPFQIGIHEDQIGRVGFGDEPVFQAQAFGRLLAHHLRQADQIHARGGKGRVVHGEGRFEIVDPGRPLELVFVRVGRVVGAAAVDGAGKRAFQQSLAVRPGAKRRVHPVAQARGVHVVGRHLAGDVQPLFFPGDDGVESGLFRDVADVQLGARVVFQNFDVPDDGFGFGLVVSGDDGAGFGAGLKGCPHDVGVVDVVAVVGENRRHFGQGAEVHEVEGEIGEILGYRRHLNHLGQAQCVAPLHVVRHLFGCVHHGFGVGHRADGGEAALGRRVKPGGQIFFVGQARISQVAVHVDEPRHEHLACAVDFAVVVGLDPSPFLVNFADFSVLGHHLAAAHAGAVDDGDVLKK